MIIVKTVTMQVRKMGCGDCDDKTQTINGHDDIMVKCRGQGTRIIKVLTLIYTSSDSTTMVVSSAVLRGATLSRSLSTRGGKQAILSIVIITTHGIGHTCNKVFAVCAGVSTHAGKVWTDLASILIPLTVIHNEY
jgi:hypothetical protein